ncbi:MAG TPA: hypothetical protein VFY81_14935 [Gammaproteobacteria bacterium]|nr:hypothetical protein [Gammaproteobacteria bacterium]
MQDRALLAANTRALQQRALHALATPQALAGSFAAGFAVAMLRGRRRPEHPAAEPKAHNGRWLRLLLRDVAMPLVLGMLQAHTVAEHDYS